jgi:SAM-dependent methyltransferase
MHLLPASALIRTSEVDHADWNFRPLLGSLQRVRFRLVLDLLESQRPARLLEIGYGSGVFMPELARRCGELYGIDPHGRNREVAAVLEAHLVTAELHTGSAERLPFADGHFDAVVSVSALEYVPDIDSACREIRRVLKPDGVLVVVTPGSSPILDLALTIVTGESASQYGDRRGRLLPALTSHFVVDAKRLVPSRVGKLVPLYTGLRLR